MTKRSKLIVILVFIALITLPYGLAALFSRPDVFGGFLLNPIDGNSYLAKMKQGALGEWRFHLPYTAEPGEGAYLFLFYILLGHLSNLLQVDTWIVFHVARVAAAIVLALAVDHTVRAVWPEHPDAQRLAFLLTLLGSGIGWLAIPFGKLTTDMWVAEAYPFLASFANPHFPLGQAAILWILEQAREEYSLRRWEGIFVVGCLAAVAMPFSPVVAGVVMVGAAGWRWANRRGLVIWPLTALIGAAVIVLAQFLAIRGDPVLAAWDAQNLTPAPNILDMLLSMSPALILAIVTIFHFRRSEVNEARRQMMVWLVVGWILIYLPFNLQRRFITGYFIPAAVLAGWAITGFYRSQKHKKVWPVFVIAASLITNFIVLASGMFGAIGKAPPIVIRRDEMAAYQWLAEQPPTAIRVLAAEWDGLRIPAYSGQRVLYGHPFETVDAEVNRLEVNQFYRGVMTVDQQREYLVRNDVNFILYGPEERALGNPAILATFEVAYSNETVIIYSTRRVP